RCQDPSDSILQPRDLRHGFEGTIAIADVKGWSVAGRIVGDDVEMTVSGKIIDKDSSRVRSTSESYSILECSISISKKNRDRTFVIVNGGNIHLAIFIEV